MITTARRAFPGMVVTMLLAGPAFAGTQAITDTSVHTHKAPHLAVVQKKPSPARSAAGRTAVAARDHKAARDQARGTTFVEDTSVWADSPATGPAHSGWKQTGAASWYGGARWAGHMTASGVRYNENAMTAAHASLPIGTRVVVALNGSERSVVVTINDRPGSHSRIIDLSREAARQLGIMGRGVATVTLSRL
jgi:rare lipoprotein A